jgi:CheY-like chemotaxis protein
VALGPEEKGEDFMAALLPQGIEVYVVHSRTELFDVGRQRCPEVVVIDYDDPEFAGTAWLEDVRSDPKLRPSKLVLLSRESGLDFVRATMRHGVVGYIARPINLEKIRESMDQIIKTTAGGGKRREFVRVKPGALDNADTEIFLNDAGRSIGGQVLDISLGGVACRLRNPSRINEIEIGRTYPRMEISFSQEPRIHLGVSAVAARGDTIAFRFTALSEESLRALCKYVHRRLTEGDDGNAPGKDRLMKVL